MELTVKDLEPVSVRILTEYYENKLSLFWEYMHPECLWIGPREHDFVSGKENIYNMYMSDVSSLRFSLSNLVTLEHKVGNGGYYVVIKYRVKTYYSDGIILEHFQWCTMVWQKEAKSETNPTVWRFVLVHTVNADLKGPGETIYPKNLSRITTEQMQELIRMRTENVRKTPINCTDSGTRYFSDFDIVDIEARGQHSVVHTIDGNWESTAMLKNLEERLPECFYRCSRTHLVNMNHIDSVRPDRIILDDGSEISVPHPRFAEIKNYISDFLSSQK